MELKIDVYTKLILTLIFVALLGLLFKPGGTQILPLPEVAQAIEGGVASVEDGEYFVTGADPFLYRRVGERLFCLGEIRTRIPDFAKYEWLDYEESKH